MGISCIPMSDGRGQGRFSNPRPRIPRKLHGVTFTGHRVGMWGEVLSGACWVMIEVSTGAPSGGDVMTEGEQSTGAVLFTCL